jgi:enoyl-CoA hydratase/carnithine racemase
MTYKCLIYEVKDGVATLTLNRPERLNALGDTLRDDLQDAVTRASDDPEVRVMIVTGAGKGFCSGGDVKAMSERKESGTGRPIMEKVAPGRDRTVLAFRDSPKPVIAAVNGAAAGAGMNLALCCDMRLASTTAKFAQAFVRRGLHPDWGGTYFLPRVVGTAKACELIFTGEIIDAQEALRLGIVSAVHAPEELLPAPRARAQDRRRPADRHPAREARDLPQPRQRPAAGARVRDVRAEHLLRHGGRGGRDPRVRGKALAVVPGKVRWRAPRRRAAHAIRAPASRRRGRSASRLPEPFRGRRSASASGAPASSA